MANNKSLWIIFYYLPTDEREFTYLIASSRQEAKDEAVREAKETEVAEIHTKVIGAEHLIALSLIPFRQTDKYRISRLIEIADRKLLDKIIDRFDNGENQLRKRLKSILGNS